MRRPRLAALVLLLVMGGAAAMACGPDFPWQLFTDRKQTLDHLPDNSFAFEAAHLVPVPADAPKPSEIKLDETAVDAQSDDEPADAEMSREQRRANTLRIRVQAVYLTSEQQAAVRAMRNAPTDDDAKTAGASLANEVKFYTLGARAFHAKDYVTAATDFTQALAGTPPHSLYTIWASYMLGRTQALQGNEAAALQTYADLRKAVVAEVPDPLNLAIASYGEEGRIDIQHADALTRAGTPGWQQARAAALKQAIRSYAAQAAINPDQGADSLLVMADEIIFNPGDLDAAIDDDITRKLVVAYAVSRGGNVDTYSSYRRVGAFDKDLLPKLDKDFDPVQNLLHTLQTHHIEKVDGSDRIAALAYQTAHYDLAAGFAAQSETPLAYWLRAKLAVHDGKRDEAAPLYAKAIEILATDPKTLDADFAQRLRGERAVLTLSHQDYLMALDQLYPDARVYWGDVAYLAERILTTDEVKGFVDAHVPSIPDETLPREQNPVNENGVMIFSNSPLALRELLGRRLMRDGRTAEAVAYFSKKNQSLAKAYEHVLTAAKQADSTERAKGLHAAALIERKNGLELLGTELDPDFAVNDGNYGSDMVGRTGVFGLSYAVDHDKPKPTYADAFTSIGEEQRFNSSAPNPDLRFHYRYVAAAHEAEAAKLVPQRSQAYAALLCQAASYVQSRNAETAHTYYQSYVKQGAFVPWAGHFGHDCPAPDFDEARHFTFNQFVKRFHGVHIHPSIFIGMGLGGVVLLVAFLLQKRRWKR